MKTILTVAVSMFALGVLFGWLVLQRPAPTAQHPQLFCDEQHKVPFVPADQCGGLTSCDRMFLNMGVPVPCPKE